MYTLMFALPLIGWGMLSAARYPIVLYGSLHLPFILPHNLCVVLGAADGPHGLGVSVLRDNTRARRRSSVSYARFAGRPFEADGSLTSHGPFAGFRAVRTLPSSRTRRPQVPA
jgi:hypothetical protein